LGGVTQITKGSDVVSMSVGINRPDKLKIKLIY